MKYDMVYLVMYQMTTPTALCTALTQSPQRIASEAKTGVEELWSLSVINTHLAEEDCDQTYNA